MALINLRNALMSKAGSLPRPVEYIESDGNQWIEIGGLSYGSNTGWMCDFSVLPARGWGIWGATRIDSDFSTDIGMLITGGGRLRIDRYGRSSREFAVNTGQRQQVSMNPKGNISSYPYRYYSTLAGNILQGDTWYSGAYQTTNKTVAIFWRKWQISGATPERPTSMRFYGFELREYSSATAYTTTLKLSPVSVGGVGAILDEITGETYFNMGTGDFVVGPDKN